MLRTRLALPLLAKDTLKELLADQLGITGRGAGREASCQLGAAVFDLLGHVVAELLAVGDSAIVEGNFAAEHTSFFADLPPARIVQAHLWADPDELHARALARTDRHAVHYDDQAADEIRYRAAAGEWNPLPLSGEILRLDTTGSPPLEPFVERVHAACAAG
jgi:hypothetical protein